MEGDPVGTHSRGHFIEGYAIEGYPTRDYVRVLIQIILEKAWTDI